MGTGQREGGGKRCQLKPLRPWESVQRCTSLLLCPPHAFRFFLTATGVFLQLLYSEQIERTGGDDDGERIGATHPDAAGASALAAVGAVLPFALGPGAADQRTERVQPPSALLQPGRGHQNHCYGDLRAGRHRQDRARLVLQAGRRPGIRRPEPDHPGKRNTVGRLV